MTMLKVGKKYGEWTILLDSFNNEILAHRVTDIRGSNKPYYDCLAVLNRLTGKKEEPEAPGSLPHRPGSCLLFRGFLPSPQPV